MQQSANDELEGSRVTSKEKQPLTSQCEGQTEEKTATEEGKEMEKSQDALQIALSPVAEEAEPPALNARDSQSEMVSRK